jgi:hypothetical protein
MRVCLALRIFIFFLIRLQINSVFVELSKEKAKKLLLKLIFLSFLTMESVCFDA